MRMLLISLILASTSQAITWEATVIFPDNEVKTYSLDKTTFFFPNSVRFDGIRCWVGSMENVGSGVKRRMLGCVSNGITFLVPAVCRTNTHDASMLHVINKANKYYRFK